ncbi:hypothetical protein DOT_2375 [Desulfosporosinus sp. OT]|nr:hypothetical protein DOT_2375 [Desulfosporosinus sp. OT]
MISKGQANYGPIGSQEAVEILFAVKHTMNFHRVILHDQDKICLMLWRSFYPAIIQRLTKL